VIGPATLSISEPPAGMPDRAAVMAMSDYENFPVASRLLGRAAREHLRAIYGYARLVDELGDTLSGDRLGALEWLERELDAAFARRARHPIMVALSVTIGECELPREPFIRLIEANRLDQRVSNYETWDQLALYCGLSANPVGELVLGVFGEATAERVVLSDAICTALQLTEHLQDVAEDRDRGRVYLPAEDLERFRCTDRDLAGPSAGGPLRAVIAFEVDRARGLLTDGQPLVSGLRGRPKLAVAAFIGGGRAALDAIERARWDVLRGAPRAGKLRRAVAGAGSLFGGRW
jgi:squalene synthase HpnC